MAIRGNRLVDVGRGAKQTENVSSEVVGFQPLNHNKQKCRMSPNNNHDRPGTCTHPLTRAPHRALRVKVQHVKAPQRPKLRNEDLNLTASECGAGGPARVGFRRADALNVSDSDH